MKSQPLGLDCSCSFANHVLDFDVSAYGGTKSIVISTTTVMGGRNPFLGIAYIVVAGICVVLGIAFTIANFIKPRSVIPKPSFHLFVSAFLLCVISRMY